MPGSLMAIALAAGMCMHRQAWLVLVPGLAPVIDLAAWSGAIHLTESDALVFSALLAGGLREALTKARRGDGQLAWRFGALQAGLLGVLLASYALSTDWGVLRGMWTHPEWRVGYASELNGARLAKGVVWAVSLLPLLASAFRREPELAARMLVRGILLGLALVSLAALWERLAFTDLTDFASDYRTTALFWEMNVGGATLDAWLALSVPFALWAVLRKEAGRVAVSIAGLALVVYVCFTTFSRGLYLGLALGCALTVLLVLRGEMSRGGWRLRLMPALAWSAFVLALGGVLAGVFQTGGYRGLAAMLGVAFLAFASGPVAAALRGRALMRAALLSTALIAGTAAVWWIPKAVYLVYAVNLFALAALLRIEARERPARHGTLVLAGVGWLAGNAALVNAYWSEGSGLAAGLLAALVTLLPLAVTVAGPQTCWRLTPRSGTVAALVLGALSVLVVTFNTYYAGQRFDAAAEDLRGRVRHWTMSAGLPQGDRERWLGVGVGRYSERYFWRVPDSMYPGSHRVMAEDGDAFLRLGGPRHALGFGELYRVSQRVSPALRTPLVVAFDARAPEGAASLRVEVCRKHLLYTHECTDEQVAIPAGPQWWHFEFALDSKGLGAGWRRGLPKQTVFSVANATRGRLVDVDRIAMIDARGVALLDNGDFFAGGDYWFFSSDRHHLPWHAKNLWLHYLVEQGVFGALAFSVFGLAALYRVVLGGASGHPLAPPLAGGLLAFFAVGAFDSLVDAPRLTLFALLLMCVALGLRAPRGHGSWRSAAEKQGVGARP
ncbi:MAG: hypothetical protein LBS49_08085 [Candidatus Accumulibacter sp.]|nr:hypothetical protein [Accumulibacter sp.]